MPRYIWINMLVGLALGAVGYILGAFFGLPEMGNLQIAAGQNTSRTLLEDFLENEKVDGGNARQYFCDPNAVQRFFSLRDWEIISEQMAESSAIYSVRVESSTKGGIPIIKNWKIFITESEGDAANKYCIITISES